MSDCAVVVGGSLVEGIQWLLTAMDSKGDITAMLELARGGDKPAQARLMEAVYGELRRLAAMKLGHERRDHTLQPSALVNEAWLRMIEPAAGWLNRGHFFALAATTMRNVLVDYARARNAKRRAAGRRVELDTVNMGFSIDQDSVILLDRALTELTAMNARHCRVVELHFFGGMTFDEIGENLGVSSRTAKRYWDMARSWLQSYMRDSGNDAR